MATYRTDITRNIEPAMANPATLAKAAEAKAGAVRTLAGLAGEAYKGYVDYQMAGVEKESIAAAGEFLIKGQAAEEASRQAQQLESARGTLFDKVSSYSGELTPQQQGQLEGQQKQLASFDSEINRLKLASEGGMSNKDYLARVNSITREAIAKFPGLATQIREKVGALTGLPGADLWAQMRYVQERFTPPKESKVKSEFDVALKDMDDASKTGLASREELLGMYNSNRAKYDETMGAFKQIQTVQNQNTVIQARLSAEKGAGDQQADLQRPSFAAVFSGALGTSVLTSSVKGKEEVFGTVLNLMAQGKDMAVDIVPFETTIKLHQAQMRTNIEGARTVAYKQVEQWINNNPNTSETKRKELYSDVDRLAERSLATYADDKGVGLVAMATIMRTYRDKSLAEKSQLVDLAIKQQTAMQNNPMVMAYWAGGAARENLKVTNRSFYEFMVGQEAELTSSMAGVRADIKGAGGAVGLSDVTRIIKQAQQNPTAVPVDPLVEPAVTRAGHQALMASATEVLKKAQLNPMEVTMVSSALSTSAVTGANSQNFAKQYRTIGDKILKLSEPDQAIIKSNVSTSVTEAVLNIQKVKTDLETKHQTKLILGINDAGEITIVNPTPQPRRPLPGQYGARAATTPADTTMPTAGYIRATSEFNNQLRPVLNNIVFGRAMLTKETPQVVGADFAKVINDGSSYGGFFSMEGKPVAATVTPVATTPVAPAAPAASAAQPATSSGKNWWEQ